METHAERGGALREPAGVRRVSDWRFEIEDLRDGSLRTVRCRARSRAWARLVLLERFPPGHGWRFLTDRGTSESAAHGRVAGARCVRVVGGRVTGSTEDGGDPERVDASSMTAAEARALAGRIVREARALTTRLRAAASED